MGFFFILAAMDYADRHVTEPLPWFYRQTEIVDTRFGRCNFMTSDNCIIDGDTFRYQGRRIRILGIDTPETHPPRCEEERLLGEAATQRLDAILNEGPFTMVANASGVDIYGRDLRYLLRDGQSIVSPLIEEGYARHYGWGRRPWC